MSTAHRKARDVRLEKCHLREDVTEEISTNDVNDPVEGSCQVVREAKYSWQFGRERRTDGGGRLPGTMQQVRAAQRSLGDKTERAGGRKGGGMTGKIVGAGFFPGEGRSSLDRIGCVLFYGAGRRPPFVFFPAFPRKDP